MPLHIGSLTADVTVVDGEQPLSDKQLARVAQAVLRLLAEKERDEQRRHQATCITRSAVPSSPVRE
jgi:hypothetical protein